MKKILSIAAAFIIVSVYAYSQCAINNNLTTVGFYPPPDSLDCIERDVNYSADIQFVTPATFDTMGFTINIDTIEILSVSGMPTGIAYSCNPPTCQILGGENGCINIFGVTNDPAGQYVLTIMAEVSATAPILGPIKQTVDLSSLGIVYYLTVIEQGSGCRAALAASISGDNFFCPGGSALLTANATNSTGNVSYSWSNGAATQSITVSQPGSYSVTVTDQTGSASASINVTSGGPGCQNGCTALPSLTPSSCVPQQLPGPGFSDTAVCVVQGQAANVTVYFQNFGTISGVTVEWIKFDSITGLPCGLSLALNAAGDTLSTSENGCITFTGTTNAPAGIYQLGIWVSLKVNILPNPISGEAGALSAQFGGPPFAFNVVVNNPGDPCPGAAQVSISGNIITETTIAVHGVTVAATGISAPMDITGTNGTYGLLFNSGESFSVTPSKSNDVSTNNGNTTLDILLIRRHILNVALLNSPYKIIAGDVNASNSVSTADILLIRALILQVNTSFPNNKLWAFVPDDYVFADPLNPFPFPASRTYNNFMADLVDEDFIGIKLGDVNNDWNPLLSKTGVEGEISFAIDEREASAGQEITVPVKVKDFRNVTGYQFTLSWNPEVLELLDASNKSLNGFYGMQKAGEGFLTTAWDDEMAKGVSLNDDEVAFELKFRVKGDAGSFSEIKISSEMTASEAYNENLDLLAVRSTNGMVKVGNANRFHPSEGWNLSVSPNPFTNFTQIIFDLPQDETVMISIYDILGKEVKRIEESFRAGKNEVKWAGDDNSANSISRGLYLVRMTAGSHSTGIKAELAR